MKLTLNWLKRHRRFPDLPYEKIIDHLQEDFMANGAELEEYKFINAILVGELLEVKKEKGMKVSICTVKIKDPKERVIQILCGADNVRKGLKVIIASLGAVIKGITINKRKIGGYESCGMILSAEELGHVPKFAKDISKGIMECNEDVSLGIYSYDDILLDIESTANRIDFKSVRNIAKSLTLGEIIPFKEVSRKNFNIKINNPHNLYCQITKVENFQLKDEIIKLLKIIDHKSSNQLQSFNDFVRLDLGHPINIMDTKNIKGDFFIDKNLQGEWILKDSEKTLAVIGKKTLVGFNNETKNIYIEISYPPKGDIIDTYDSVSAPFFKGLDYLQHTMKEVLNLLEGVYNPTYSGINPYKKKTITMIWSDFYKITGENYSLNKIREILKSRGFKSTLVCVPKGDTVNDEFALEVEVPSWRNDLNNQYNIIEEIIRKVTVEKLEKIKKPTKDLVFTKEELQKEKINYLLITNGFQEQMTLPFVEKCQGNSPKLVNPMNQNKYLRSKLYPSLLQLAKENIRNYKSLKVFQWGRVFNPEEERFAMVIGGNRQKNLFSQGKHTGKTLQYYLGKLPMEVLFIGKEEKLYYMEGRICKKNEDYSQKSFDISFLAPDNLKWEEIAQLASFPLIPFDIYEREEQISYAATYYCGTKENLQLFVKKLEKIKCHIR